MGIPKFVWQTWKTHTVPEKWAESPASIKALCPDFDYRLFDDRDNLEFVEREFPQYLDLYRSFDREIYRADMIRYLRLYKWGGVYMDLDLKLRRPLKEIFNRDCDLYLVRTPNGGGYTNSFMASKPQCPFWLRCIEEIRYRVNHKPWWIQGDWKVIWTTGPGMITKVATEYDRPFINVPYKLGHPCSVCDHHFGEAQPFPESWVEELEGSSWTGSGVRLIHTMYCQPFTVIAVLLIVLVVLIVLLR